MAPQTKSKLTIHSKPNQTVFNQTQSKEIYQSKLNQSKQKKTNQTKKSKSAAQLLSAPVLVFIYKSGSLYFCLLTVNCRLVNPKPTNWTRDAGQIFKAETVWGGGGQPSKAGQEGEGELQGVLQGAAVRAGGELRGRSCTAVTDISTYKPTYRPTSRLKRLRPVCRGRPSSWTWAGTASSQAGRIWRGFLPLGKRN